MPLFDKAFNRELWWLLRPSLRKPDTPAGHAARRLSRGVSYPCWRADLDVVLAKVWELSASGYYVSPLSSQSAAVHIADMLRKAEERQSA
jgi:hypothetical protein